MATGSTAKNRRPPREGATQVVLEYDEFVDRQLSRVRSQIKSSDVVWSLMTLVASTVGFLLALALIDHWVAGLGRVGRMLALAVLVVGVTMFLVRRLFPLLWRRINPAYAALVVEQSEPSLKNSLLNLILFRGQKRRLRDVVYHAVEQQAATGLSHVDIDATVDRAPLVRMAGALALIVSVAALYTVLSPKSSLQTVARVMAPWRDIPRPSRVMIRDVQPGTTQVFAGRSLEVSAIVERLGEDESVWLVYSTADRQELNQRLSLQPSEDSLRMTVRLPAGTSGIYQDIDYYLEAGDALAGPYRVKVLPAPSIVVDQITYDFPEYTGLSDETVPGHGDIVALEGTRVTIEASANQNIRSAELEFDPESGRGDPPGGPRRARKTVTMKVDGRRAQVSLTLALAEDRQTPLHDSYWLKFVAADGGRNDQPVVHRIEVRPDLAPLVEILTPERREITVPVDGRQPLEVRAVDPDFQLRSLELVAVTGGDERWRHALLTEAAAGQVVKQFDFEPGKLGFKAGDTILYWAVAGDNRDDAVTASPAPNITRTDRFVMRITAPANPDEATDQRRGPGQQGEQGEPAANGQESPAEEMRDGGTTTDEPREADGEEGTGGEKADARSGGNEGSAGSSEEPQDGGEQSASAGDQTGGEAGGETGGEAGGEAGGEPGGESREEAEGQGGSQSDASGADAGSGGEQPGTGSEDQPNSEAGGQPEGTGGRNDAGGAGQEQGQSSTAPSDEDGGEPGAEGEAGSEQERRGTGTQESGSSEGGDPPLQDQQTSPRNGRSGTQEEGTDSGESMRPEAGTDPLPSDGSRDADAFERILNRIKERKGDDGEGAPDRSRNESSKQPESPPERSADREPQAGEGSGERDSAAAPDDGKEPQAGDDAQSPSQRPPTEKADAEPPSGDQQSQGEPQDEAAGAQPPNEAGEEDASAAEQRDRAAAADEKPAAKPSDKPSQSEATDPAAEDGQPSTTPESEAPESDSSHSECTCNNTGQCRHCQAQADGAGEEGKGQAGATGDSGEAGQGGQAGQAGQDGQSAEAGENPDQGQNESEGEPQDAGGRQAASDQQPGESGDGDESKGPPADSAANGSPGDQSAGGSATGHDRPSGGESATSEDEPGGDDPNLEYARRATQMALEYLKDQQENPDQELLDELGWQREDVQRFLARWQQLQQDASQPSDEQRPGSRELEDALRSLGLYPDRDQLRRAGTRTSKPGGAVESGARSRPPTEYLEAYRAYLRSKSDTEGE